jgi:imidazole glycerol-phosphate synthase subunit HisF
MLKNRLIPVLLLKNGMLVRSEKFTIHQIIGNPLHEVRRFNEWNVDELIYLDISPYDSCDLRRNDAKDTGLQDRWEILDAVSRTCFMPLTWGGRIRTLEDIRQRINRGADKVAMNWAAVNKPELLEHGARVFGAQAIVASIDSLRHPDGRAEVFVGGGRIGTGLHPRELARRCEENGAGEILLQSIDRDGTGCGYDLELISEVAAATRIPVIALGGVGSYDDYVKGIHAGASAVAAANIWHFKELSDRGGKRALARAGIHVRV